MKKFQAIAKISAFVISTVILVSCSPFVSIKTNADKSVEIAFKTGFSAETSKTLKTIVGIHENEPLFHAGDMIQFFTEAGASNVSAKVPSENEVESSGTLRDAKKTVFYTTGILEISEGTLANEKNSISLRIGSSQIEKFYNLLDENSKSYIDMMMIPSLIGEKMSTDEYRMLLSAMYGPKFANELVDGKVTLQLEAPNGKVLKFNERLGDLLTLTEEKIWTLEY